MSSLLIVTVVSWFIRIVLHIKLQRFLVIVKVKNTILVRFLPDNKLVFQVLILAVVTPYNKYTLFDGLTYNARGYFASCVVFFRAP